MKNYSQKTNRKQTRYRTPSTFRMRKFVAIKKAGDSSGNFRSGKKFRGF